MRYTVKQWRFQGGGEIQQLSNKTEPGWREDKESRRMDSVSAGL